MKSFSYQEETNSLPGWLAYDSTKDSANFDITADDISNSNRPVPKIISLSETLGIAIYVKSDADIYAKTIDYTNSAAGATENTLKSTAGTISAYRLLDAERVSATKFILTYQTFDSSGSVHVIYARTFTVSGDVISADSSELTIGTPSSSSTLSIKCVSATRAIIHYITSGNVATACGVTIGSGTLTKDASTSGSASGDTGTGTRAVVIEDSATIGTIGYLGDYKRWDYDASTTTMDGAAVPLYAFVFGGSASSIINGAQLLKHPSADNRVVALLGTRDSAEMGSQEIANQFLFQLSTSSGAVLAVSKLPSLGPGFRGVGTQDFEQQVGSEMFTIGTDYFMVFPSWNSANSRTTGYYQSFTIARIEWGSDLVVTKQIAKDLSGNGLVTEGLLFAPQISKVSETSLFFMTEKAGGGLQGRVCRI